MLGRERLPPRLRERRRYTLLSYTSTPPSLVESYSNMAKRTVKIAVVGSGLAGLTAAYRLAKTPELEDVEFEVHVFEKVSHHLNLVSVECLASHSPVFGALSSLVRAILGRTETPSRGHRQWLACNAALTLTSVSNAKLESIMNPTHYHVRDL